MTNRIVAIACLIVGSAFLSGCDDPAPAVAKAAPPEVSVVRVKPEPFTVVRELPGRIASVRVAEVRPRVSGIIVERLFKQGRNIFAKPIAEPSASARNRYSSCSCSAHDPFEARFQQIHECSLGDGRSPEREVHRKSHLRERPAALAVPPP